MANNNKSAKDIQYSIWNTRTDKNPSFKPKEAIDLPDRKDQK